MNVTGKLVNAYLIERAQSRASIVGTNLDFANSDPHCSSPNNLPWINKLSGPFFGKGSAVHSTARQLKRSGLGRDLTIFSFRQGQVEAHKDEVYS